MKRSIITAALATLLAFACAPAPARDCDWHIPGANPYTGDPAVAIGKLVEIPPATRAILAYRALKPLTYDDVVYITRDEIRSVRSTREYHPDIMRMNEGGGAICDTVSRKSWSQDHVESAIIFCEDGYCVGRISVCDNWAIFRRVRGAGPIAAAGLVHADGVQLAGVLPISAPLPGSSPAAGVPGERAALHVVPVSEMYWLYGSPGGDGWWTGGGLWPVVVPGVPGSVAPVSPIPEAPTWAYLLAGIAAGGVVLSRRRS